MQDQLRRFVFLSVLFTVISSSGLAAQGFETWLSNFRTEAASKGISDSTLNAALTGISPIERVIELDRKQPEGTMTFDKYRERVISQQRINTGRYLLQKHRSELDAVSKEYGVPPQFIVALWGIETSFGDNTGGFKVVDALATLAYDGRRSDFFRKELFDALRIIDAGHKKHPR